MIIVSVFLIIFGVAFMSYSISIADRPSVEHLVWMIWTLGMIMLCAGCTIISKVIA